MQPVPTSPSCMSPTGQQVPHCLTKLLPWQGDPRQAAAERDRSLGGSLGEAPSSGGKTTAPLPGPTCTPAPGAVGSWWGPCGLRQGREGPNQPLLLRTGLQQSPSPHGAPISASLHLGAQPAPAGPSEGTRSGGQPPRSANQPAPVRGDRGWARPRSRQRVIFKPRNLSSAVIS